MDWHSIIFNFITIGVVIDLIALICIVRYEFGLSFNKKGKIYSYSTRGIPAGLIFYLLGVLQLIFINKKPLSFAFIVLLSCVLFYALVIFSAVILSRFIKIIRRIKAHQRKVFITSPANDNASKIVIEHALKYLTDGCSDNASGDVGFIYLNSNRAFKNAIIHVLSSKESRISVGEWDPGDIIYGRFAESMTKLGFPVDQWGFDKRNKIVVPFKDYNQIPLFLDVLFSKYYNCGDNCQIRAEVMKMR